MASDNQPHTLMNIPLEVRHQIFEYVAIRDAQPKKLLRYWFEKKEVKEKTAELATQNPNSSAPQVVYGGDRFEHEEHEEDEEDDDEGEEDSDEDSDEDENEGDSDEEEDEDSDEGGEEEEADEDEDEAEEQEAEMDEAGSTTIPVAATSAVPANAQGPTASTLTSTIPTAHDQQDSTTADQDTASAFVGQSLTDAQHDLTAAMAGAQATTASAYTPTSAVVPAPGQGNTGGQDADTDMADEGEEDQDAVDGIAEEADAEVDGEDGNENADEDADEDADGDSDEEMAEEGDDAETAAQPPAPAPVITAHRKWRHIPQFMRITRCPPPVELLLASKQLNTEAKSWYYDVAVLRIEATGSFAHTSFFEEAFSQITEAAFSPMEDIRKVEITFVWDTTWLRSEQSDCAAAIFPALLRQRAIFVTGILAQAPNLSKVTIHWHDSAQDEEAVDLMNDVLMGFLSLDADVKVETHYIAADTKPHRKSIAGKQRGEFQRIVDNGLDSLF